jgi:signal transduction histidine kinase/CheY-like chemotaxis protein
MERHDRMALVEEINERVRAEEKLKASEALLRTLYEISVQTTDWVSRLQHILQIGCSSLGMTNAMFLRVAGQHCTIETMVGEQVKARVGETYGLAGSYCEWTMTSREPVTFDRPDSSDWKPPSCDPLIDPQAYAGMAVVVEGEICGVVCFWNVRPRDRAIAGYEKVFLKLCAQWIGHEIEREASEKGIRAAKDQAEAANRAKSEFLATMSHEIRTPMNAIVGMADLLAETELSTSQKEYLGVLSRSTTHLIELIDDILDLSKVESGRVQLEQVPFDLNEVLDKCAEALASRAQGKRLELIVSVAPDVPSDLIGDPRALRQITWNLLTNAIKFTERGQVRLRVTNDAAASRPGTLHFAVSDTGIGIPADKHALIFERFTQADSSTTRIYGGTGLGLAIAKHLVELAGGRIWVKSSVGIGTDFYFTMPFEVRKEYGKRIELGGARVHVMIQHAQSREAVSEFLTARNATVTASPEVKATEATLGRAVLEGVPYQFLVVDVTSIDLESAPDHLDLMITARDCGTAVILIVEDVASSAIATFYRLGLGAYVPKPLTNNKLEQTFLKHAQKVTRHKRPSSLKQESGLSILVAEDSPDNQRLVEAYLKGTNHRMEIAENGRVAYEMYKAKQYDLVLMDVQMPVMDGLTATRMIREWERHERRNSVPILALTAHAYEEQAQASLAAGCSAHMTKPVRKGALLSEIEKWLLQRRSEVAANPAS